MITTIEDLSRKIDRLEELTLIAAKNVLDLDEAVLLTGYSRGHLYRLTSRREIPHFKKDRKLYFRKDELEAWMTETSIPTERELQSRAALYCVNDNHKTI